MDIDTLYRKINAVEWYQRFELLPGVFTPGKVPTNAKQTFSHFRVPQDLTGKEVLEIGTWDGPIAFEADARGARVTALDIQDPSRTGFNVAKEILGADVAYIQGSVYDATKLLRKNFDYIFFLGVFYHLKHPIMAFEEISKLLTTDGILIFEGECLRFYCEDETGARIENDYIRELANSNIPLTLFYANTFKADDTNWFIPNFACLKGWLQTAGLEIESYGFGEVPESDPPLQRVGGVAHRVAGLRVEHRIQ
jgi:tRNA (mo5U34)-methyltransferase